MTAYRVLVTDDLLLRQHRWPRGFRIISYGPVIKLHPHGAGAVPVRQATVTDDDAPPELEGRLVEVTLARNVMTGEVTVASRTVVDE